MGLRRAMFVTAAVGGILLGCGGSKRSDPVPAIAEGAVSPTSADAGTTAPPPAVPSGVEPGPPAIAPPSTPPGPDECAGLLPDLGTPVEIAQTVSDTPFCHPGTSNGRGTAVAFGIGLHHLSFEVHPMTGGARLGFMSVDHHDTGPVYDAIAPSSIGFHALTGTGVESIADRGVFSAYDDQAALLSRGGLDGDPRLMKADPGGGTVLLTLSGPLYTPTYHLEIVDANGRRTVGAALDAAATDLAVAPDGHVLVIAGTRARWFDHDATPLTGWFDFQYAMGPALGAFSRNVLDPLADGTVALHEGPTWTLVFPNGVAGAQPAPAWLASRAGTDAFVIRGGKANAFVALPTSGTCGGGDTFEVVSPSGHGCGTVTLPAAPGCTQVTIGRDGTAFTLSVQYPAPGSTGNQLCTWRWWPGVVR